MQDITLSEKVDAMIAENQHLRVKSDNDDTTISLMRAQYDALASTVADVRRRASLEVEKARDRAEGEITEMTIERDQAIRAFKEIDTVLMQAADLIMQALRARQGEATPETMQVERGRHLNDDRLPIARLS